MRIYFFYLFLYLEENKKEKHGVRIIWNLFIYFQRFTEQCEIVKSDQEALKNYQSKDCLIVDKMLV